MMKRILVVFWFLGCLTLAGQAPEFEWVGQFGGNVTDFAYDVKTDQWGNIYVTGSFRLTADADFGSDEYLVEAGSESDIYIAKYAPDRSLLWIHTFDGGDSEAGLAIALDTAGYVYLVTSLDFDAYVDFDPGPGTSIISTDETKVGIILKLTNDGDFVWVKSLGGEENFASVSPSDIEVDEECNIYITGLFRNTPDFDPGEQTYILSDNGFGSIFVSKLTQNGEFVWARSLGGSLTPGISDIGWDLALDSEGDVYVTGYFDDDLFPDTLLENSLISLHPIGDLDMFVVKFAQTGELIWAENIGDSLSSIDGRGLVIDQQKNVYITGSFTGAIDFDSGQDQFILMATGLLDAYILKLNSDGNFIWAVATNSLTESSCSSTDLAFDKDYNLYAIGLMNGTVDFDAGTGEYLLSDEYASYIWKIDTSRTNKWAVSFGGLTYGMPGAPVSGSLPSDLFVDLWGNIYSSGVFRDTVDFDQGAGMEQIISNSGDAFLHKMRQLPCPTDVASINENNNITICSGEALTLSASLPDSIFGFTYQWSTSSSDNSISVSPNISTSYAVEIYHSPACYSSDTILVVVLPPTDTISMINASCDVAEVGMQLVNYADQFGCDSFVLLTTVLSPLLNAPLLPSNNLFITSNSPPFNVAIPDIPDAAVSYEWEVPTDVAIIAGQGSTEVTIDWSDRDLGGSICVQAVDSCGRNGEVACMEVEVEIMNGIVEYYSPSFRVFPNPVNELLCIYSAQSNYYDITLFNSLGNPIRFLSGQQQEATINVTDLPNGLYFLSINSNQKRFSKKILIAH